MFHRPSAFLLGLLALASVATAGPYPGPVGQAGSTAIAGTDPAFVGWATGWSDLVRGYQNVSNPSLGYASFGAATNALGPADATLDAPYSVVSLGDGGSITLTFDHPIVNGPGNDLAVFENAINDTFLELGFVEVSSDGVNFFRFNAVSLTPTNSQVGTYGAVDTTNVRNLAGKYRAGYGTSFDLDELKNVSPLLNVNHIVAVRVKDVVGSINPSYGTTDSLGNLVNDPWPTPFPTGGFDLDAIGALNQLNLTNTPLVVKGGGTSFGNWGDSNGHLMVSIGFQNVSSNGGGSVTVSPYSGLALGSLPGANLGVWDINASALSFETNGGASLTLHFSESYSGSVSNLAVMHFGTNGWEMLPIMSVDLTQFTVTTGLVTSFSPFAVIAIPEPSPGLLSAVGLLLVLFRHSPGSPRTPGRKPTGASTPRPRTRDGFTLLELLITVAILALLAGLLLPGLHSAREKGRTAACMSNLRQLHLANSLYADDNDDCYVLGAENFLSNLKRWHGTRISTTRPFDPSKGPLTPYLGRSGRIKECETLHTPPTQGDSDGRFFEKGCGGYGYNMTYLGNQPGDWTYTQPVRRSTVARLNQTAMFADAAMAYPEGPIEYSFMEPPYWVDENGIREDWGQPVPSVHFRHSGRANVVWCDGHVTSERLSQSQGANTYGGSSENLAIGWFGPLSKNADWCLQ